MTCPKCAAAVDPRATECPHCGVIISKAIPEAFRPAPVHVDESPKSTRRESNSQLRLAIGILALLAVAYIVKTRLGSERGASGDALLPGWYAGATGYSRAVDEQSRTNQPVLIYFHTDWCGWCKKLDADLFRTDEFTTRYKSVLKVKVNPENGSAEHDLAREFGVNSYPTVIVVNAGRRQSIVGYFEPAEYMSRLDSFMN